MDKKILFNVFLIVFIILILSLGNLRIEKKNIQERVIYIYLNISNYSNAWMDKDSIYFISEAGKEVSGSTIIENNENNEVNLKISISGDLYEKRIISISDNRIKLGPKQKYNLDIKLNIPSTINDSLSGIIKIQ